jgi:DNA-binding HxlR family transcriptional regulator
LIRYETEHRRRYPKDRAGTLALRLLAPPLNVQILQALAGGPLPLLDLRRAVGFPPQTTLRAHLRSLSSTGIVVRRRQNHFPGDLAVELTDPGRALLRVDRVVRRWLEAAPSGSIDPGSPAAKSVVKTLAEAWASNMVRALAARPLSLTELDSVIPDLSYPSLERRLTAMRVAGQVEKVTGRRGATPYGVTDWLRRATAPLIAAVRWEREHIRGLMVPIGPRDVEAAFLLLAPLLEVPDKLSGSCKMVVELRSPAQTALAGVCLKVEDGHSTECYSRLEARADASVIGTAESWLGPVGGGPIDFEIGGDSRLAGGVVEGLRRVLAGSKPPKPQVLPA